MDSEILNIGIGSIEQDIAQERRGLVALLSAASITVWAFTAFVSAGALV